MSEPTTLKDAELEEAADAFADAWSKIPLPGPTFEGPIAAEAFEACRGPMFALLRAAIARRKETA